MIIKDKSEYKRIKEYNDITWIEFVRYGEVIEKIAIEWIEHNEHVNESENEGQTVKEKDGEIDITVNSEIK